MKKIKNFILNHRVYFTTMILIGVICFAWYLLPNPTLIADAVHVNVVANNITADGTVSILSTEPGTKLEISGGTRFSYELEHDVYYMDIVPVVDNSDNVKYEFRMTDYDGLQNQAALTIRGQNGNVGIGTTAPSSELHVNKVITGSSGTNYLLTISGTEASGTDLAVNDNVGILFKIPYESQTTKTGAAIFARRQGSGDTDSSTGLGFSVSQNDETLDEALTILHDGNVGIGTTGPQTKAHIYDSTVNSTVLTLSSGASYTGGYGPMMVFRHGVSGELLAGVKGFFRDSTQGAYGVLSFYTRTSDALGIEEKMRISSDGSVGIGTASPGSYKLNVAGSLNANSLYGGGVRVRDWMNCMTHGSNTSCDAVCCPSGYTTYSRDCSAPFSTQNEFITCYKDY